MFAASLLPSAQNPSCEPKASAQELVGGDSAAVSECYASTDNGYRHCENDGTNRCELIEPSRDTPPPANESSGPSFQVINER